MERVIFPAGHRGNVPISAPQNHGCEYFLGLWNYPAHDTQWQYEEVQVYMARIRAELFGRKIHPYYSWYSMYIYTYSLESCEASGGDAYRHLHHWLPCDSCGW